MESREALQSRRERRMRTERARRERKEYEDMFEADRARSYDYHGMSCVSVYADQENQWNSRG